MDVACYLLCWCHSNKDLTSVMVVCAELSWECEATHIMGTSGGGERATVPYTSLLKYLLAPDGFWGKGVIVFSFISIDDPIRIQWIALVKLCNKSKHKHMSPIKGTLEGSGEFSRCKRNQSALFTPVKL